jgi:hypothetical protein
MARIKRLTPEQAAELPIFREAERRRALSTDPIDHERARASVRALYAAAGQPEPKLVLVLTSPASCLLARGLARALPTTTKQLGVELRGQLGDELRDQLYDQILLGPAREQLEHQFWDQLRDQFAIQLGEQVWRQLETQLGAHVGDQLRNHIGSQLRDQLRDQLRGVDWDQYQIELGDQQLFAPLWFLGAWDAYWLSFYEFGRKVGVRYEPHTLAHFNAYNTFARECGVSFLYHGIAFISDRPERMSFGGARRLHAADGPALRYRDGYALYAWKGQRIPAEYIERRHTRTAADVLSEQNAEMRRVLMEIYADVHGPKAMLAAMGARLIAEDTMHGRSRKLYDIGGARYVHVVDGSLQRDGIRREFLLGARPDAQTPHEAVAASYARPPGKFREAVRT